MHEQHLAPGNQPAPSLRLLVVDDNRDITESLSMLLEILGHRVAAENDAGAALARLAREPFDVCMLDIGMPRVDGLELARRIRATVPAPQPALVAMTGFSAPSDRQAALDAGFDRFLVKPLRSDALTEMLDGLSPSAATVR